MCAPYISELIGAYHLAVSCQCENRNCLTVILPFVSTVFSFKFSNYGVFKFYIKEKNKPSNAETLVPTVVDILLVLFTICSFFDIWQQHVVEF